MNPKTILTTVAALLLGASFAAAEAPAAPSSPGAEPGSKIQWKKITLSHEFLSEGAAFGDFNHDGKADVVSGPYWYEGPDFKKRHEYMKPEPKLNPDGQYSHNFFAFTRSFKNDKWDDILIIGFPGEDTSWYENPRGKETADGHWVRHKVFNITDDESPTFGDLLGNGKPVLICMTAGRLGYAQPDYADPAKPWPFHAISPKKDYQRFTHGMGFGDVNGDGKNDLMVHNGWYEQPADLSGDPQWTFHPADFGSGGAQMFAYDVNGDGRPDIITSIEAHGYGLAWFEQKEDGSFQKHIIVGHNESENPQGVKITQMHAVDLVDINGDGLKDIVTGKRYYAHGAHGDAEPHAPPVLYWFELKRDNGKVTWTAHKIDDDSGVGTQVLAQPINGDKHPAIVVGNKKGTFVFLQQPEARAAK
ncbi:MAG TPA: VCBS repeat-containing protein [Tepidisphaeraceae bacterium]|nr:VCBS repeat-containing protein [Tepidisphaeraceae bacterium]